MQTKYERLERKHLIQHYNNVILFEMHIKSGFTIANMYIVIVSKSKNLHFTAYLWKQEAASEKALHGKHYENLQTVSKNFESINH